MPLPLGSSGVYFPRKSRVRLSHLYWTVLFRKRFPQRQIF
ncbi:hypothetical protein WM41_0431 [Corynebacterium simulans]|uniref:Uncharacterized protein n=1 Tax=Corynebacterium simulans TaxID=146827 RepID=A0ABR5VB81_9CORY|nr:hypothetical protein WM41_0431 [Corynebacterium simulans]